MAKETVIYQTGDIVITRREAFGKIGLGGSHKTKKATLTKLVSSESEVAEAVAKLVIGLENYAPPCDLTAKYVRMVSV